MISVFQIKKKNASLRNNRSIADAYHMSILFICCCRKHPAIWIGITTPITELATVPGSVVASTDSALSAQVLDTKASQTSLHM